jgi:thiol:disulfide interchange protein
MERRAVLALFAAAALPAQAALPLRFDPTRDAAADLRDALAQAGAQGKRVLVDVGGEWCTWCHVLDRFVAGRPEVLRTVNAHYVWLKVNWSPQNRNEPVLSRWPKARGYPHLYVLDPNGQLLASQATSELEAGQDYDEQKMLGFLRRYAPAAGPAR